MFSTSEQHQRNKGAHAMSLQFDLRQIENRDFVCYEENGYMRARTESLIFHMMFLGMSELTEENWTEFYARYEFYCRVTETQKFLSAIDIHEHVGLTTNVSQESRTSFVRRIAFREMEAWKNTAVALSELAEIAKEG